MSDFMLKETIEMLKVNKEDLRLLKFVYYFTKRYTKKVKVPDVLPDNQGTNPKTVTT